jgi:Ni/Fe-hydrogenase subunit HybB-like protein
MELRDEYERTEPTTVRQWILDKRKPNQRYMFWIAVIALFLALVFGLIQSVTGDHTGHAHQLTAGDSHPTSATNALTLSPEVKYSIIGSPRTC